MKKIISAILLVCTLLTLLAACTGEDQDSGNTDPVSGIDIRGYTIVSPKRASADLEKFVALFRSEMLNKTRADLALSNDGDTTGENAKEILIGKTNRSESIAADAALEKAPENAYIIRATEDKIVISAKSDAGIIRAMKYFLITYATNCEDDGCVSIEVGKTDAGKVDLDSVVFDNFAELSVDLRSNVYNPKPGFGLSAAYETLIQLNHSGESNGTLLATFATYSVGFDNPDGYNIYESTDNGKSWQVIANVQDTLNTGLEDNLQPHLFELPSDIGSFKAGTIFLSACSKDAKVSKITLFYSTDAGKSWTQYNKNLAEGGAAGYGGNTEDPNAFRGVWEPFLTYEESTNRLYCFYSDETLPKEGHKTQKMAYIYTEDLVTWSEKSYVANCANLRAGMMSVTKMGNGEYFGVYMTGEIAGAPLYYKTTTRLDDWGNPSDIGTRLESVDKKSAGQSPWCTWTPAGGECGTLIVVGKYMIEDQNSTSKMFLSFDYGKTFVTIDNLIPYKQIEDNRCGYSAFLGTAADGSVFYMNNPSINDTHCQVVFTRIKIW